MLNAWFKPEDISIIDDKKDCMIADGFKSLYSILITTEKKIVNALIVNIEFEDEEIEYVSALIELYW